MVAALWGVFAWKEFAGSGPRAKFYLTLMFVFYRAGHSAGRPRQRLARLLAEFATKAVNHLGFLAALQDSAPDSSLFPFDPADEQLHESICIRRHAHSECSAFNRSTPSIS